MEANFNGKKLSKMYIIELKCIVVTLERYYT